MKLLIDDANIEKIKKLYDLYPIDGVTTNPSILAKSGRKPYDVLTEIRSFIGAEADLHVQVIARDAETMVEEGKAIAAALGMNTCIKVPTVPQGVKAMKLLKAQGYRVTATAVYTVPQAYMAAQAGADFVAPYVNRIDNLGGDGITTAQRIHDLFENNGYQSQLLAASFKNTQQLLALAEYGVGAATAAPDVIETLLKNEIVSNAVEAFIADFEKLCGTGATMLN